mmetsp:Transcript_65026/g.169162  ORF Transcript_65026/g.169162 Transcript_65026/m.169162 type:complete len:376 (+) Transcript_65026:352-1479(+)
MENSSSAVSGTLVVALVSNDDCPSEDCASEDCASAPKRDEDAVAEDCRAEASAQVCRSLSIAVAVSSDSSMRTLFAHRTSCTSLWDTSSCSFSLLMVSALPRSLSIMDAMPRRSSKRAVSASLFAMFTRSFFVLGRGSLAPSLFRKKAGSRSSGGASLSLSAPSSASWDCRYSIFFCFLRTISSVFLSCSWVAASSWSVRSFSALSMAACFLMASASASARSARAIASARRSLVLFSSFSKSSDLAFHSRISLAVSFTCFSSSMAFFFASSRRRTCSAISSFAFSSSPRHCDSWAFRTSSWSSCCDLSSSRSLSARLSTASSWKARRHICSSRLVLSLPITSMRTCAAFLRILRWCSMRSFFFSCSAFHLYRISA